ncbi:Signal transduction histidine-protein kinase atoS [Fibrisoma limi BUZ 3]|uniref:histidine kinase n=2 Tax=Fibrisoma limi TaxID=663275 RepID=I2GGM1_9BACT|nr:Signal transduction histidine-protein kinase atoS [Fibrisoma limi BUZ 3]
MNYIQRIGISLILVTSVVTGYAQSDEVDSLNRKLATQPQDTLRVQMLYRLANLYKYEKPDTAYRLGQQGYQLALRLGDRRGEAKALNIMGGALSDLGDYPKGIRLLQQSLSITRSINDLEGTFKGLNNLAIPYVEQKDYQRALQYFREAMELFEQSSRQNNRFDGLTPSILYGNIGETYLYLNELDSAEHYLQQALPLARQPVGRANLDNLLHVMGQIQAKRGRNAIALDYFRQAIPISRENSNAFVEADARLNMARLFQQQGAVDSSLMYARSSLDLGQRSKYLRGVLRASELLVELTRGRNDAQALRYFQVAVAAKDNLFNQEKVKQMLTLDFEEQQRQQDIEAAKAEYQNRIRIYGLLTLVIGALLAALLLWRVNRRQQRTNALLSRQKKDIEQERSKAEQALAQLQAAQQQLIQKEKMASLGELTAGIAHEIQNPLNFVNNFSEVSSELITELAEGPIRQLPDAEKTYADELVNDLTQSLQKIHQHGQRASAIVKGMLAHSRQRSGEKRPTDLNALVHEYLNLAYRGQQVNDKQFQAELVTRYDPGIGPVELIPQDIGRVLLNIYNNAFYAIRQQQHTDGDTTYQPQLIVRTQAVDGHVEIRVKDNGTGIPDALQPKIFQPFFTTKPTGEGTGLGLSLSYEIVTKAHQGQLHVESKEGEGTEIIIALPAHPPIVS